MLTVIGCGNANRSDDAVGVVIARRLRERLGRHPVPGVQVFDCGTAGMEVMFAARGSDALIVIDAARTGSAAGAIFEVPGRELTQRHDPGFSLHDFRWDHALAAGRQIFGDTFPEDVSVFLIEAQDLSLGLTLTEPVAASAEVVYEKLLDRIAAYSTARHAQQPPLTVTVRRGSVLIPADVYARFFDARDGVVPFAEEGLIFLMPVVQVTGGLLVKQRNVRGDRVVDAAEFLRARGWDDWGEYACHARWDSRLGALALSPPSRGPETK